MSSKDALSIEKALEKIGVSYFQYRLLVICGLSFMSDAMEVTLLSFLAECAGKDFNLSDTQMAVLTSIVFLGQLFGSLFWGLLADRYGRRIIFIWGTLLIASAGFFSGLAPSFEVLLILRCLVGVGIGAVSIPFDLLAEFVPSSQRGEFLMFIEYFWTIGSVFVVLVAWGVLSTGGWRALTMITSIPIAVALVAGYFYLPESPRWLLVQGNIREAEQIMNHAAKVNQEVAIWSNVGNKGYQAATPLTEGDISMKELQHNPIHPPEAISQSTNSSYPSTQLNPILDSSFGGSEAGHPDAVSSPTATLTVVEGFTLTLSEEEIREVEEEKNATFWEPVIQMFSPEMRKITVPLMTVWVMFGLTYYGVVLLITRLYTDSENDDDSDTCLFDFPPILENSVAEFVGITVSALFISRIGRVNLQVVCYGLGAVSVFVLGFHPTAGGLLAFAFIARGGAMSSSSATWVITPELYPTKLRATGHSICNSAARIGAFLSPFLVQSSASIQTCGIVLAIGNVLAASAAAMLPETNGKEMNSAMPASGHPKDASRQDSA